MPLVSIFANVNPASYLQTVDLSFNELIDLCHSPEEVKSKDDAPLLVFARSDNPKSRRKIDVTHATLAAFDVDGVSPAAFTAFLSELRERDISYAYHTTFSHLIKPGPNGPGRYRLFIPISEEIPAKQWTKVRRALIQHVFGANTIQPDKQANDIARLFYAPSFLPSRAKDYSADHFTGNPLDVPTISALAITSSHANTVSEREQTIVRADVENWLKRYKARKGFRGAIHEGMKALLSGDELAQPGERESAIRDLTWELAKEFPEATTKSIRALFQQSISLMEATDPEGAPTLDDVEDRFNRAIEKIGTDHADRMRGLQTDSEKHLTTLWGYNRDPADDDEIEADAKRLGLTVSEYLTNGLILRVDKAILIRNIAEHRYESVPRENAILSARQTLVAIPQVEFMKVTDRGLVPKTFDELSSDYGRVLTTVEHDMSAPDSRISFTAGTLYLSPCPKIDLPPAFDPWTDEWLSRMAGVHYDKLITWLSQYPNLEQPLPALYIEGDPNTGKSLFGSSLAAMYGTGKFVDAEDVMGNGAFNAPLVENPLVVADEHFPTDWRGNPNTHILRKFVQERVKTLRKKYAQNSTLRGCHRVIITANNPDALTFKTGANLTVSDMEAIEDRLIHIHVGSDLADWIKEQEREGKIGPEYVEHKVLARHVLWLAENHESKQDGRFYVRGECDDLINKMATSGDVADGLCEILIKSILQEDDLARTQGAVFYHATEGDVFLCAIPKGLSDCWQSFRLAAKRPTPTQVYKALGSLQSTIKRVQVGNTRMRVSVISFERLASYALAAGEDVDHLSECFIEGAQRALRFSK